MKLKAILIIGLLTALFAAPALADKAYIMDTMYSDDRAVSVHFEKVVGTDRSDVFSPFNFPPDQYYFVTLYYSLYNPSKSDVNYEFNVSIKDQANRYFYTDEFILGETVPAGGSLQNRHKDFAVYRNSTNLQLAWTDKHPNPPWGHYDTLIDIRFQEITPTPTATAVAPPAATPTPTPLPASPLKQCLPFLPIGLVLGGVGGLGWLTKKYRGGR